MVVVQLQGDRLIDQQLLDRHHLIHLTCSVRGLLVCWSIGLLPFVFGLLVCWSIDLAISLGLLVHLSVIDYPLYGIISLLPCRTTITKTAVSISKAIIITPSPTSSSTSLCDWD